MLLQNTSSSNDPCITHFLPKTTYTEEDNNAKNNLPSEPSAQVDEGTGAVRSGRPLCSIAAPAKQI